MKPTIFTYYQRIETWNHSEILLRWRENWQNAGFRTIVCDRNTAKRHPKFGDYLQKIRTFPTINDRHYEEACYLRWLAFEVILDVTDGRGLMSDYDVFNNGFAEIHMGRDEIVCHERTRVPCLVEATQFGARRIVEFIMAREPDHNVGHYSDMYAFKESDWMISSLCLEMGEDHWELAPAIHVASGAIQRVSPGADKTAFILERFK